ncbi:DUF4192 family protein [Nocardioides caeni]|uniref:DUF4192 family protein n=1 Tax=Nocardioides caeni TaxID=574700 RepID=A0A4S8NNX1_9ACTN|nr:DUF4192 family protein [Nocardioides caeni]
MEDRGLGAHARHVSRRTSPDRPRPFHSPSGPLLPPQADATPVLSVRPRGHGRAMTSTRDPATTSMTARCPEDLVAMVPSVLGFWPGDDDIVIMTFGADRPFHGRTDLPPRAAQSRAVLTGLEEVLLGPAREHGARAVVLVYYGADPAAIRPVHDTLRRGCRRSGIAVVTALHVDGERFRELDAGAGWGLRGLRRVLPSLRRRGARQRAAAPHQPSRPRRLGAAGPRRRRPLRVRSVASGVDAGRSDRPTLAAEGGDLGSPPGRRVRGAGRAARPCRSRAAGERDALGPDPRRGLVADQPRDRARPGRLLESAGATGAGPLPPSARDPARLGRVAGR